MKIFKRLMAVVLLAATFAGGFLVGKQLTSGEEAAEAFAQTLDDLTDSRVAMEWVAQLLERCDPEQLRNALDYVSQWLESQGK